jgi:hypothetical protein
MSRKGTVGDSSWELFQDIENRTNLWK